MKIFAALFMLAGAACTLKPQNADAGPPPVIDSLQLGSVAAIGSDGLYDLTGTISFHSDTSTVATIHVVSTDLHTDYQIHGQAVARATSASLTVNFPPDNPIGTTGSYSVSVIDEGGLESAPIKGTVTLQ
jgi:hypothetical protein